jgi:large subunit ribosomal protein L6
MSRLGKNPIAIPAGVTVKVADGVVSVKGPKTELKYKPHPNAIVEVAGNEVRVSVKSPDEKFDRSLWGLTHKLVINMIAGVTAGFSKQLEIIGVGFKVAVVGSKINLDLGFSHPVVFELPKGVEAKAEKNILTLSGPDKQVVGQAAAAIRKLRKPEPYKGKGIRYVGEAVRQKAGKAAKAAGAGAK